MRWLLLFLIVFNVVVLFWFEQQKKAEELQAAPASSVSSAGATGITLLSEVPARKIKYKKPEPKPKAPEPAVAASEPAPAEQPAQAPAVADAQPVAAAATDTAATPAPAKADEAALAQARPAMSKDSCGFLGPFAEPITVRQVASRLKRAQIDSKLYSESMRIDPVFWVYLRPAKSRSAALATLRQLHAARIESFIVGEGEDTNAISLGFYKKKESAEAIQKERIGQGYDARLVKKERQREQYWAVVQPQGWSRVDASLLASMRAEYGEFTRRTRKCSFVASLTQFE